ncbi:MAG: accessory gene regulator B family protein [Firmicutes bacterium]|nr:accessory gene regulator B family protein [Bacillota bacterium]
MLNNIIDKNIIFLQNHGVKMGSEDDKAVYKYGLQILYLYIIDLAVIFSLAYSFGKLYETAIMTFIFALLQVFGGGYHAKTPLKCLLTMVAGAFIGNVIILLFAGNILLNIILTCIVGSIILLLTPVVNKNHPVSRKIKRRSKLIIRVIVIFILTATIILGYLNRSVEVAAVMVTVNLYVISLITAKIKN